MKPFNLERAIAGDPVMTRDGREVRFIAYAPQLRSHSRVLVSIGDLLLPVSELGLWGEVRNKYDLFMDPKTRTSPVGNKAHKIDVTE